MLDPKLDFGDKTFVIDCIHSTVIASAVAIQTTYLSLM